MMILIISFYDNFFSVIPVARHNVCYACLESSLDFQVKRFCERDGGRTFEK